MTIAEIAEKAGVSKSAVSRYLNHGYISEEKREKIQKVIEETGYIPSAQAQTLRTGKSRMVGVIVPRIDSDSISRIVSGISEVLEQQNYRLLLANTHNDPQKELEYLEFFRTGNVDAVIFLATILTPAHKKRIQSYSVPLVMVGQTMQGVSCVTHDDFHAAQAMTQRLVEGGCQQIACICVTQKDQAAGKERLQGVQQVVSPVLVVESDFSIQGGYAAACEIFSRNLSVDGVFCATDSIAIGAMQYLREQKIRVPDQVQIVGIGDSKLSRLGHPTLTTAKYYYEESGKQAANLLIESLNSSTERTIHIKLGHEICVRQSTK